MRAQFRKRIEAMEQRTMERTAASAAGVYERMSLEEMQAEIDAGEDTGDPWADSPDWSSMSIAEIEAELEVEMADAR